MAAPLLLVQNGTPSPIGTILLAVDVRWFAPLVDQWPVPSASGETLLAVRQGDIVANLNALIASDSPGLAVHYFQSRPPTCRSSRLCSGKAAAALGSDQYGMEALAGFAAVPGTPWRIAAQMDMAEIDAPLTSRFGWYVGTAAGVVGLGLALASLLLLAHQQRTLRPL